MAQGRGNAKAILCVIALLAFSHAVAAKDIIIGGSTQKWDFPPGTDTTYYATWSAKTTFAVGDNLVFQYQSDGHDVQEVSASQYNSCLLSDNPRLSTGFDKIPLTKAGDRYFICAFIGHCEQGMKVKVTVGAAAAPPTTPPATPPVTPVTPPVTPVTPPVTPATPPATPPTTPPVAPPVTPPAPTPVIVAPTIAPTPVPEVAPPTSVPEPSPTIEEPAPASTESPTTSPAPAPGSAHSVRVGFGVVGAAVVAAIGALLF